MPRELYLNWLIGLVDDGRAYRHPTLFQVAWETEFIYSIPMDANRYRDGLDLREEFKRDTSVALPDLGPCTVLEFLIGVTKRLDYILYDYDFPDQLPYWFWLLIENLGIFMADDEEFIRATFIVLLNRKYDFNGEGGLFPLLYPDRDQRKVEVWQQMQAWIIERRRREN